MKTKQQIQDEIAELQKQLEEMGQPKTYHYLMLDGAIACNPIKDIFNILPSSDDDGYDQPHGLGKFETREEAEDCRAALIFILDLAKQYAVRLEDFYGNECTFNEMLMQGQRVIKAIEEGTYE